MSKSLKKITEVLTEEELLDIDQRASLVARTLAKTQEEYKSLLFILQHDFMQNLAFKKVKVGGKLW